ncbi:helix-turn-helix domain-containing protein [Butyricimonas virosa]
MKTTIDKYITQKVIEKREEANITQEELSHMLGFATGSTFVSQTENTGKGKYNIYHLNELAKIFDCDIADFLPRPHQAENSLKEYRDYIAESKRKAKEERESKKK